MCGIVMFRHIALIWVLSVGWCRSVPTDEFRSFIGGELSMNDDGLLMGIVPGRLSNLESRRSSNNIYEFIQQHEFYKTIVNYTLKGTTKNGLTFNIYDEDMKEAARCFFQLTYDAEVAGYSSMKVLSFDELNEDLVSYAFHLNMLYRDKRLGIATFVPPFISKPNFFVNSETIIKALKLSNSINYNINSTNEEQVNQYYKTSDAITINTNYSGWNLPSNGGEEELNYFREDISLNSYYYGVHLMHPYWMLDHKLYSSIPRHDEHYYYLHQQLFARYLLEKEHLIQSNKTMLQNQYSDFNPYLIHENGLPFPVRSNALGDWSEDRAKIKSIDIAIKECLARGLIMMENTDPIKLTEDNYISLITKLVRANFEVGNPGKIIRSLFGYGGNGYPYNEYNPAPSLLHHPQTNLRDPIYWYMIQYVLKYFTEYMESQINPYDLQQYETTKFQIMALDSPKITTYFDYYQFNINRAISKKDSAQALTVTARQKRLKHAKFQLNFTVNSLTTTNGIVRIFLGPPCPDDCWDEYTKFFELDKFVFDFKKGINIVTWSPETSTRLSNDKYYNMEASSSQKDGRKLGDPNDYSMFKFPDNLVIPRGLEKGLNLTMFIMITLPDNMEEISSANNLYADINKDLDNKPLGFPFHRPALANSAFDAPNYKFYNITVYHKRNNIERNGYFSPHLN